MITNPSGVTRDGTATIELLRRARGVRLVALFGPEHGVRGDIQAREKVEGGVDRRTGLKVHSLYGAPRKPTPEMLQGLDAVVYDLQDTGVRSYTFISTMGVAMEACAEAGVEFVVLDRPNPLGGVRVEGPMMEERFRSFVGQWNVPYVYGLTCGELARMIIEKGWIRGRCRLTVVPMTGWRRAMLWRDTGPRWLPSSPNIPRAESPLFYASTGLFGEIAGGSGLSIGTSFGRPFEVVVAPWLNGNRLARELKRAGLNGVTFTPFATPSGPRVMHILKHNMDTYRQRFGAKPDRAYLHMDLAPPEIGFVEMAKGMGVAAERVARTEEVAGALARALASGGPYLLDIVVEGKA